MRDMSRKSSTLRTARAMAVLRISSPTVVALQAGNLPKGDPISVAKVAGIQAAKQTSLLIPYCHQIPLNVVSVDIVSANETLTVTSEVKAIWKTGVEMEALVAATTAALTLYDMLKPIDKSMEISSVKLLDKKGGKSSMKEDGHGLRAGVLVLSDSVCQGKREDVSGKILLDQLKKFGFEIPYYKVLPDQRATIEDELRTCCEGMKLDLLLTTGGTGVGPRDVTPEATNAVIERRLNGVEEVVRRFGQDRVPTAMLSRGIAGTLGRSLIINLPGSQGGALDGIDALFPAVIHAFRMLRGEGHD